MYDSYRLVSLLDMLKFNAEEFIDITTLLVRMESILTSIEPEKEMSGRRILHTQLEEDINPSLQELGLKFSLLKSRSIMILAKGNLCSCAALSASLNELRVRIFDELGDRYFLSLNSEEAQFYESSETSFGLDVQSKFASVVFEIDEAGKCMALGRYTAVVFHLMRTVEAGLSAVARCLEIPDPVKGSDKNWGTILRKIGIYPLTTSIAATILHNKYSGDKNEIYVQAVSSRIPNR